MATGRPSTYTPELATKICERLSLGESLRTICRGEEMPVISTVMKWLLEPDKTTFSEQYKLAREAQAEIMFEELLEIADNSEHDELEREYPNGGGTYYVQNSEYIQRSRLRVDTRKWYLSKVLPKKFADKQLLGDPNDQPIAVVAFNFQRNENNRADDTTNG